ncbi:MAG: MarR family transcriptional regulator [Pseudomonadota bacterium]
MSDSDLPPANEAIDVGTASLPPPPSPQQDPISQRLEPLELWRRVHLAIVQSDAPDLTIRQYAILLSVYMNEPPHTVRGLASSLSISKPAVVRAIDSLSRLGYLRRRVDPNDRRSVLIQRTVPGSVFLSEFADLMQRTNWDYAAERGDPFARG